MSKTQIFIEKARAKHGDSYDYGRVTYVRNSDKVTITCKKHGDFEQRPGNHLSGGGCAKCGFESAAVKRSEESKNSFIERSRAVHGDRYGYDRVFYVRSLEKVIITCKIHGDFEQRPNCHLQGYGCDKCGKESTAAKKTQKAKDGFIARARTAHGDRYDYSKAVYVRDRDKIIITCKKHGDFDQTPGGHLRGLGCAICGIDSSAKKKLQKARDSFIDKARAVHGDHYDYSKAVYVHSRDKVIITCTKHGDFEQSPANHLMGNGCARCSGVHRYSTQEWIQEAVAVHGDRYSYDLVVYVHSMDKVIITCAKHGDFEQVAYSHLSGNGCPSCPARRDQPTNLYLMHNGLGKVKVGYSIDTDKRITELNRDAPFEAELLETWTLPDTPTVRKIEGKVHRKLAKYHAGLSGFDGATEWFNVSPERAKGAIIKALSGTEVLGHSEADSLQLALI